VVRAVRSRLENRLAGKTGGPTQALATLNCLEEQFPKIKTAPIARGRLVELERATCSGYFFFFGAAFFLAGAFFLVAFFID
jgi:hypothetical protein